MLRFREQVMPDTPRTSADHGVTTTHRSHGGGRPRLVLEQEDVWEGEGQPEFRLTRSVMLIGSDRACDIVLPDLEPLHTVVSHDDHDEYLVESCGPEVRVHGAVVVESALLRTGARVDIGPHTLSFFREEHADHGRPYGGREGGEIGHQHPQPDRNAVAQQPHPH
jgi:hypothetical protein